MPDGRDRHLSDEPEIELTVTTLSLLVRDAGNNGTCGALTPSGCDTKVRSRFFIVDWSAACLTG
jgi:hypothetical protein